ncbi:hypothetical protein PIB30_018669 [Stylosanthes scabra]|uniref:Uncharacterized protein n=1 Tax=Stylosanthes scabra TaxID=79078 RepID=A0ABU6V6Y7_9FABA|nr:hypothetical protein [Stylosanthes scabra]
MLGQVPTPAVPWRDQDSSQVFTWNPSSLILIRIQALNMLLKLQLGTSLDGRNERMCKIISSGNTPILSTPPDMAIVVLSAKRTREISLGVSVFHRSLPYWVHIMGDAVMLVYNLP